MKILIHKSGQYTQTIEFDKQTGKLLAYPYEHKVVTQHGEDGRATSFCDLCGKEYNNPIHIKKEE